VVGIDLGRKSPRRHRNPEPRSAPGGRRDAMPALVVVVEPQYRALRAMGHLADR
jgi:hypothetical protein